MASRSTDQLLSLPGISNRAQIATFVTFVRTFDVLFSIFVDNSGEWFRIQEAIFEFSLSFFQIWQGPLRTPRIKEKNAKNASVLVNSPSKADNRGNKVPSQAALTLKALDQ